MRYWVTTHWPLREGLTEDASGGVWLPEGREGAGATLSVGDHVIVYESRSGRTKLVKRPDGSEFPLACRKGREGVIYYGRVVEPLHADAESEPEHYTNNTTIWWRWSARLEVLSRSGFVPRSELMGSLGYKPTWNLRGFGTLHSGLMEVSHEQYADIVAKFHDSRRLDLQVHPIPRKSSQTSGRGESVAHERLKRHVADHPEAALREAGMRTVRLEYPFPTGDRADVVLADIHNRVVAVEVETTVGDGDVIGPLQAIKYRFMLEWLSNRESGDSRAVLVAHSIALAIRELCAKYAVECVEIQETEVQGGRPV